jgi:hypothetical protein
MIEERMTEGAGNMSIRKRLLLSNLVMILIPVPALLFIEMLIGIGLVFVFKLDLNEQFEKTFLILRFVREKIETDPSNPDYIETIWGAGYRFKP